MNAGQFAHAMKGALISGTAKAVGTVAQIAGAELRAHTIAVIVCVAAIVVTKCVRRGRRRT